MSDPTIKVMIGAGQLQEILARHGNAEAEIVASAVAQIAGRVAAKISDKLPNVQREVERVFEAQITGLRAHTRLHPDVKKLIQEFLKAECKAFVDSELRREVTEQALARVNDLVKARMTKVESEIAAALVKAETDLERKIVTMAEREFVKLVRGAAAVGGQV